MKSFDEAPSKHLLIAFDLTKLVFNNLVFIPLGTLSPKIITFCFSDVKSPMLGSWWEVGFFKRGWDCCCGFSCWVCCCICGGREFGQSCCCFWYCWFSCWCKCCCSWLLHSVMLLLIMIILFVLQLLMLLLLAMLFFLLLLQLMMLVSLLLLMLMHKVYVIISELMIWRVLFI